VRAAGGLVIHVVTDGSETASGGWPSYKRTYGADGWKRRLAGLSPDTFGYKLHKDIDVAPGDVTFVKTRFSAFLNTPVDLDAMLKREKVGTLLVTGTRTEVCCESTIRDAMMLDWTVVAVDDGMSTIEADVHAAATRAMCPRFAALMTTKEIIASLADARVS
jgi:ureidoacrylate peracid hydrolase